MAAAKKKTIPKDFSALLSARGRKLTPTEHAPVVPAVGLLDGVALNGVLGELERHASALERREALLPPANSAVASFADRLPLVERREVLPVHAVPEVRALLDGASFRSFAEALAGSPLEPHPEVEVFGFGRDGYVGPQTGPRGVRLELTLCRPGAHQLLVHASEGHLANTVPVAKHGTVVALRLPHWHFTTPLQTRAAKDRRWVLRATFKETSS